MKLIKRNTYLNKMINTMNTPDIKVITGVHRAGKSKLLEEFMNYIKSNIKNYNIIHINYNLTKYENINEYHKLVSYVDELYNSKKIIFSLLMKSKCVMVLKKLLIISMPKKNMIFI